MNRRVNLITFLIFLLYFCLTGYAEAYRWNFTSSVEGWSGRNATVSQGCSPVCSLYAVTTSTTGTSDPGVVSPLNLNLQASINNLINLSLASNWADTQGYIYFSTVSSPNMPNNTPVPFYVTNNGAYNTYQVDMTYSPQWTGTITQIRIDPANNGILNKSVGFDYIETVPIPITPTLSVTPNPVNINSSITMTCSLTAKGASRTASFFYNPGSGLTPLGTALANSSGIATLTPNPTVDSAWGSSPTLYCRDETLSPPIISPGVTLTVTTPPATISGGVRDARISPTSPIAGATVYLTNANRTYSAVSAPISGVYTISNVVPDTYSYYSVLSGYLNSPTQQVTLFSGQNSTGNNLTMEKIVTPTISVTPNPVNINSSITMTCSLTASGASRTASFFYNPGSGLTPLGTALANSSGIATLTPNPTVDSAWGSSPTVLCRDELTLTPSNGIPVSVLKGPPTIISPLNGSKAFLNTNGKVILKWQNVTGNNGYDILIDGSIHIPMSVDAVSYDATLPANANHNWQICTKNSAAQCGSYSSLATFYLLPTPTISSTSYSINVGNSVTLTCDLSSAGAGRGVDIIVTAINNLS